MKGSRQKKPKVNPCLVCPRAETACETCPYNNTDEDEWVRTLSRDVYGYNPMDDD